VIDMDFNKLKLKYEVKLLKHGYYFLDVVNYNPKYLYIEFKNMKGSEKLLNSIIRIWRDLQTKNTNAELIINGYETRDYKHLSIKELFALLEEIEETGKIPL
jgi:hypothetical protein